MRSPRAATCIWQERYLGRSTSDVEQLARERNYALYILTEDDIEFEQDGLRDGALIRTWMTDRFAARLDERPEPWLRVRGSRQARLAQAIAAIDEVVATGWRFAAPR
jgi:HTH-type transcriptional repressor of NAD biosynthesis genes